MEKEPLPVAMLGVLVGSGVLVGATVGIGVAVGTLVGIGVAVGTLVGFGVAVGTLVGFGVAVGTLVGIGVAVGTLVGFGVAVGTLVGATVLVGSSVGTGDGVGSSVDTADLTGVAVGVIVTDRWFCTSAISITDRDSFSGAIALLVPSGASVGYSTTVKEKPLFSGFVSLLGGEAMGVSPFCAKLLPFVGVSGNISSV